MSDLFIPGHTIGIIGGGHIGRLLALSAKSMGFLVGVFDPEEGCATAGVADWQIVAEFDDEISLVKMAEKCDILTVAEDQIDLPSIREIENLVSLPQSFSILEFAQDRLLERGFLEASNVNIAPYATISKVSDIQDTIDAIGFPCILKSVLSNEKGLNQHILNGPTDVKGAIPLITKGLCILEAMIPFEKEISVMIAGNGDGNYSFFPIVENYFHRDGRLINTVAPAKLSAEIVEEAYRVAEDIAVTLNVSGILTIQMFITESNMLYVNSMVARPHDSGHYSIDACNISQFDAHIRGICGWPLPQVELYTQAVTLNIVQQQIIKVISQIPFQKDWLFHFYGMKDEAPLNQAGHVTILSGTIEEVLEEVESTRIWES